MGLIAGETLRPDLSFAFTNHDLERGGGEYYWHNVHTESTKSKVIAKCTGDPHTGQQAAGDQQPRKPRGPQAVSACIPLPHSSPLLGWLTELVGLVTGGALSLGIPCSKVSSGTFTLWPVSEGHRFLLGCNVASRGHTTGSPCRWAFGPFAPGTVGTSRVALSCTCFPVGAFMPLCVISVWRL